MPPDATWYMRRIDRSAAVVSYTIYDDGVFSFLVGVGGALAKTATIRHRAATRGMTRTLNERKPHKQHETGKKEATAKQGNRNFGAHVTHLARHVFGLDQLYDLLVLRPLYSSFDTSR